MSYHLSKHGMRRIAVAAVDRATHARSVRQLITRRYGGHGSILMWHRVVPDVATELYQDISCSISHLRRTIEWARRRQVAIVDMDEALRRLTEAHPERFIVLTFDDGYRDNLQHALPVCERYGVPMTVYVATGMVERSIDYWWGALLEAVRTSDQIEIDGLGVRFDTGSEGRKRRALAAISRWVEADVESRCGDIMALAAKRGVVPKALLERDALSMPELRRLADHPLVTVGSHTMTHRYLAPMSSDDAWNELMGSRRWLESAVQRSVQHLSFPHGDVRACGFREAEMAKRCGYVSAVSTRRGNVYPVHYHAPYMLPRGAVNGNRETTSSLEAQISGLPRALSSRWRAPIDPDTLVVRR